MLCYLPREYMYLDILHVFHTYPKPVQDTFWDTHQIHQDTCICSLPMCHTGYTTGYIKIHQDTCILDSSSNNTSKYNRIQNHDTCILDAGYMRDTCICKGDQDTCGIHPRYMMRYMYLKLIVPSRIQTRPQVELEIRILEGIPMYPTCIVSKRCRGGRI